ncbi:MAG: tRNA (N6-isopentenyl adenosine(37)-C2)-methylthiotransferase MiaB [Flavobacteriales bacterium CG_4_10_14_0_2_um_filter_32_8]|nr:MAG: tRNA (N6-isopentenyl adenosine(37)-C2)-methylthiotransferase MiaB [Flavobacteriales bacterium CG_4_10_14_0_2_um_filter_32_8]PJB14940.1 MAG: tRNA (N6-isopentenyl adenosine(37)-C2)-methylthiotransferase MiaB [Flavobacteriales bacterium CG_4_9_14_3_um_filter_32_8]
MELGNKIIDEAIQGNTVSLDIEVKGNRKVYIESYGCQMNFSDSEIVASILSSNGFNTTNKLEEADVVFVNTCSIREKAEQTIRQRLRSFQKAKKKKPEMIIGVLGCMAERLKSKFLEEERLVDIVVGPDAYRDLPNLVEQVDEGKKAVNVILSKEETYADISPVRLLSNGVTAFISITRGCDNMCTFCVVPFTRGRERSRNPASILNEAKDLFQKGFKEVTLLGQNVDSYLWQGEDVGRPKTEDRRENIENGVTSDLENSRVNFSQLMEQVALISPKLRVRFSTSHPKDITDEFLNVMSKYDNICKYIHLPFQSGNSRVLELMNRGYTREWYMNRIDKIKEVMPDCAISTDIIAGFCSETEEEHQDTLSLMEYVKYDFAYMFKYSERPNTLAERQLKDDVSEGDKSRRLAEIVALQRNHSFEANKNYVGRVYEVLVEKISKKSTNELAGRTSQNTVVVFPQGKYKVGDYVQVQVYDCTGGTLLGEAV